MRIDNFGKTWSFEPNRIEWPCNADQLSSIVKNSTQVRVMGARHSWSKGIITEDTLVTLDDMNRILDIDKQQLRVRVQAGIRLYDLVRKLEQHGLALANLGSIAEQSLAGAISTGTHGTGIGFGCLADQVQSFSLIDGNGEKHTLDRDHPDFNAVIVGFGGFGIIYEMTLSVVPTFQMHAITEACPFDEVIDNLDEIVKGHDHFKFWWFVPNDDVVVFKQQRTDKPRNDSDIKRWFKDEFLAFVVYRAVLAIQKIYREPMIKFTNNVLAGEYAKRFERICKSHIAFLTPKPPVHRETEWAFDFTNAKSLLRDYREHLIHNGYSYSFIQEIRFTKGDEFWASPAYKQDSIWLSMYNIDKDENWDDQFNKFEEFARSHGGRPHWGKEATLDPDYLLANFPKFEDFLDLMKKYDPESRFANLWLQELASSSSH